LKQKTIQSSTHHYIHAMSRNRL